jgi:hypothetical protein
VVPPDRESYLDEVALQEAVAPALAVGANPANQREEEQEDENRKSDGEQREELLEVQVHGEDALVEGK